MENNKFSLDGVLVRKTLKTSIAYGTVKIYSEGRSEYLNFVCFSDACKQLDSFIENDRIHCVCRLHSHSYEQNGKRVYRQDIIADSISPLT